MIFVTFTSSASLRSGVVKTFRWVTTAMRIEIVTERDFVTPTDCPFTETDAKTAHDATYRAAWQYVATNSFYEISGDGGAES